MDEIYVYYKIDGNICFYCNEQKEGYSVWSPPSRYLDAVSYLKVVVVELTNGKFILPKNSTWLFAYARNEVFDNIDKWDTSNCTIMAYMFDDCARLLDLNCSSFDTSHVTNFEGMFQSIGALVQEGCTLNISNFNTSSAVNMGSMFRYANEVSLDVTSFDTSNVVRMGNMFEVNKLITELDLSWFDFSKCRYQGLMFQNCTNLEVIYAKEGADWKTECELASGNFMFQNCTKLRNYSESDTSINRANVGSTGMLTAKARWNLYSIYEKVSGTWTKTDTYVKDSESWNVTEVYR